MQTVSHLPECWSLSGLPRERPAYSCHTVWVSLPLCSAQDISWSRWHVVTSTHNWFVWCIANQLGVCYVICCWCWDGAVALCCELICRRRRQRVVVVLHRAGQACVVRAAPHAGVEGGVCNGCFFSPLLWCVFWATSLGYWSQKYVRLWVINIYIFFYLLNQLLQLIAFPFMFMCASTCVLHPSIEHPF